VSFDPHIYWAFWVLNVHLYNKLLNGREDLALTEWTGKYGQGVCRSIHG
jgi:hypothetical protein